MLFYSLNHVTQRNLNADNTLLVEADSNSNIQNSNFHQLFSSNEPNANLRNQVSSTQQGVDSNENYR